MADISDEDYRPPLPYRPAQIVTVDLLGLDINDNTDVFSGIGQERTNNQPAKHNTNSRVNTQNSNEVDLLGLRDNNMDSFEPNLEKNPREMPIELNEQQHPKPKTSLVDASLIDGESNNLINNERTNDLDFSWTNNQPQIQDDLLGPEPMTDDDFWSKHLSNMSHMKSTVPVTEFKTISSMSKVSAFSNDASSGYGNDIFYAPASRDTASFMLSSFKLSNASEANSGSKSQDVDPGWLQPNDNDNDIRLAKQEQSKKQPIKPRVKDRSEPSALKRYRDANQAAARDEELRLQLHDAVHERVDRWRKNKEHNIRALLSSLDIVMWQDVGWKNVSIAELVQPHRVKITYMKAIAKVHPDKIGSNISVEYRMIAGLVFSTLNDAWHVFRDQNNM